MHKPTVLSKRLLREETERGQKFSGRDFSKKKLAEASSACKELTKEEVCIHKEITQGAYHRYIPSKALNFQRKSLHEPPILQKWLIRKEACLS